MKQFILYFLALFSVINCYYSPKPIYYSGTTTDFKSYDYSTNGIYVDVKYSDLKLTKKPQVTTTLHCDTTCWQVTGVNSIYFLTKDSFRVYLRLPSQDLTTQKAKDYKYVLHYMIYPQE